MLFELHDAAQPPQLFGSVARPVSQPSVRLSPLQSPKPLAQEPLQVPAVQLGVTWFELHEAPQLPQLLESADTLVSQPSARLSALQSPKPLAHEPSQVPTEQVGDGT